MKEQTRMTFSDWVFIVSCFIVVGAVEFYINGGG